MYEIGDTNKELDLRRPTFDEGTPEDFAWHVKHGYDRCELKMDGIYAVVILKNGKGWIWSRGRQLKATFDAPGFDEKTVLLGEYMHGSNWAIRNGKQGHLYIFDCLVSDGEDISSDILLMRQDTAKTQVHIINTYSPEMKGKVQMVKSWDVDCAEDMEIIWSRVNRELHEGVVLKRSCKVDTRYTRVKRTVEVDYVVTGFLQSEAPKYIGRMVRSIQAGLYNDKGELVHITDISGITDQQRTDFFQRPEDFIGRVFKAVGYTIFESGAIRHPSFHEWHPDKPAEECTLAAVLKQGGWEEKPDTTMPSKQNGQAAKFLENSDETQSVTGTDVEAQLRSAVLAHKKAVALAREAELMLNAARAQIKEIMQQVGHSNLTCEDGTAVLKTWERTGGIDTTKLAQIHPDAYADCLRDPYNYEVLRVL